MNDRGVPGANRPDKIVITTDDLDPTIPVETQPAGSQPTGPPGIQQPWAAHTQQPQGYATPPSHDQGHGAGGTGTLPPLPAKYQRPRLTVNLGSLGSGGDLLTKLGANSVVSGLVAGGIGGAVGLIPASIVQAIDPESYADGSFADRFWTGLWFAAMGVVLGALLMGWEGITSGSIEKALLDGALGAVVGAIAGFIGGFIAEVIYDPIVDSAWESGSVETVEALFLLSRMLAWAVLGGILGFGLGIRGGQKKMVNGLLGGLAGGACGGAAFEVLELLSEGVVPELILQLIGLTLTGIGIGVGIGLVERLRRDAWLLITGGPMAGKEFILYKDMTSLGADYRCDVVLVKDRSVSPRHATLRRDPSGHTTVLAEPGTQVLVNGNPITHQQRLSNGDTVTVGQSALSYQERVARA